MCEVGGTAVKRGFSNKTPPDHASFTRGVEGVEVGEGEEVGDEDVDVVTDEVVDGDLVAVTLHHH